MGEGAMTPAPNNPRSPHPTFPVRMTDDHPPPLAPGGGGGNGTRHRNREEKKNPVTPRHWVNCGLIFRNDGHCR